LARRQYRPIAAQGFALPLASGRASVAGVLALGVEGQVHRIALRAGESAGLTLDGDLCAYAAVLRGKVVANGMRAAAQDGLAIAGTGRLVLTADAPCELLLVRTRQLA
jgi:redox-sensitive bicupin YhaK (pirin superfamily)